MTNYYLDTSIWIDIYDKRGYNGRVAKALLQKIILQGDLVVFSDAILIELKNLNFLKGEIKEIINILKNKKKYNIRKQQISTAQRISKKRNIPLRDVLHAIIARDSESQLVSRDWDFDKLKDITLAKLPEELL